MTSSVYLLLADLVLFVHILFVLFVVFGLVMIYVGALSGWNWVKHRVFRTLHLIAIGVVVLQAWLGVICPLTTLEMWLRAQGGGEVYAGSFISHWMQSLLYYNAPTWVFVTAYTVFGAIVLASFWLVPPQWRKI